MKKIMLCCNAGMSTSLLVQKMQAEVANRGLDIEVEARPMNEAHDHLDECDMLLLGPQIGYTKGDFEKEAAGRFPVEVINSYVGTAKSMYINAVQKAKEGDFDAAEELIKQGDEAYNGGHDVHMGLLKKEAKGERNGEAPLILLHAEDQMAGTETMRVMATELIEVHKQLQALQA